MSSIRGKFVPLSAPRCVIGDILHISQSLALVPCERKLRLAKLVEARNASKPRPSWLAMFIKAMSRVSVNNPELRRVIVKRPWQRIFQYEDNIVGLIVERDCGGEPGLFIARIKSPENMTLAEIDASIRRYKERPIPEITGFNNALRMVALPLFLRRFFWWVVMNWMPRLRAKLLGNLGISITAGMGGVALALLTPWTLTAFYDAFEDDGSVTFRSMFDHRVLDGRTSCRFGRELERELCGAILEEVRGLIPAPAVAPIA